MNRVTMSSGRTIAAGRRIRVLALATGAVLSAAVGAQAADGTWIQDGNGNWNTATTTPWSGDTVAQGADSTASFNTIDITGNRAVTLTAPLTIGKLAFGDTSGSQTWILNNSGGAVLTLQTTSGTPTITVQNAASSSAYTSTISAPLGGNQGLVKEGTGKLILSGTNTFTGTTTVNNGTLVLGASWTTGSVTGDIFINNSSTVQFDRSSGNGSNPLSYSFDGVISGTGKISKTNNAGILTLTGNNTYSGGTTIGDGGVLLGNNSALGSGAISFSLGRVGSSDNTSRTVTNTLNLANNVLTFGAPQAAASGLGDLTFTDSTATTNTGTYTMVVNNATAVTLSKQWTGGTASIIKNGTGTLVLNGANHTYNGATTINAGTLLINGAKSGSGAVTVNAGGTFGGIGTISGATTVTGGTLAPGNNGIGTLTFTGNLSLNSASILSFDLNAADQAVGSSINDELIANSNLVLDGTLNLTSLTQLAAGTYTLIHYTGSLTDNGLEIGSNFGTASNQSYAIVIDSSNGNVNLAVTVPEPAMVTLALGAGGLTLLGRRRRA